MTVIAIGQDRRIRELGAGASLVAGVIYLMIGYGVVSIGTSTSGSTESLIGFGLLMAALSIVVAAALLSVHMRAALVAIAVVEGIVIAGYFALSGVREPPVELWGLVIKVLQALVLASAVLLAMRAPERAR